MLEILSALWFWFWLLLVVMVVVAVVVKWRWWYTDIFHRTLFFRFSPAALHAAGKRPLT